MIIPTSTNPLDNLLISLGCNGRGVALSTAMGAQLARRLVGGGSADIDMPITGIKPMPLHAFGRSVSPPRLSQGGCGPARDMIHR